MLAHALAREIGRLGKLAVADAVRRTDDARPPQAEMGNPAHPLGNVWGATAVTPPPWSIDTNVPSDRRAISSQTFPVCSLFPQRIALMMMSFSIACFARDLWSNASP